jgi:hypothetical protein
MGREMTQPLSIDIVVDPSAYIAQQAKAWGLIAEIYAELRRPTATARGLERRRWVRRGRTRPRFFRAMGGPQ